MIGDVTIKVDLLEGWNVEQLDETTSYGMKGFNFYKDSKDNMARVYLQSKIPWKCDDGVALPPETFYLNNGDKAFSYSDGVIEIKNALLNKLNSKFQQNKYLAVSYVSGMNKKLKKELLYIVKSLEVELNNTFYGTVISSGERVIRVRPNYYDTMMDVVGAISRIRLPENSEIIYPEGAIVKIIFDTEKLFNDFDYKYLNALNVELIAEETFTLSFEFDRMYRQEMYVVVDKNESDMYDYNIYEYNGHASIKIGEEKYLIREALLGKRITMEEIMEKANKYVEAKISEKEELSDGTSILHRFNGLTIIKDNMEGDVYILDSLPINVKNINDVKNFLYKQDNE